VSPLTPRERDVLVAARSGASAANIAADLFLSEGTVRNYLSAAIAKAGAATGPKPFGPLMSTGGSGL
jgi:two-component system response regulator DesR